MPSKRHEWACPKCGMTAWTRTAPPKPGQLVYRAPICKTCKKVCKPTGKTMLHYSLTELL